MTKIDIFSGFLGAGKTTLIKKLIREAYAGEQIVLIENEFGEIGIDGGFMADAGVKINELNSGCICCSLVGDFAKALKQVKADYDPDRIIIEPSGVGKLSDVVRAVERAGLDGCEINSLTAVVDANKCKMYMKNFGEFFNDQIETAACIVFSHTDVSTEERIAEARALVRERNAEATLVTTPLDELEGSEIVAAMEHSDTLETALAQIEADAHEHHHDDDDEEEEHHHHHHHDDDDEEEEHHHHHHHDDDDEDDDDECCCDDDDDEEEEGEEHGHHHHHHHHHADEVFTSWGVETGKRFTEKEISAVLSALADEERFGLILRAKGIVAGEDGKWIHFDFIPEEQNIRTGPAAYTGRLCVIGSKINEEALKELFGA